jgi:hypothetical protein
MEQPISITGRVIDLYQRGFTDKEILLELHAQSNLGNVTLKMVKAAIARSAGRGADSRRLFEIAEMCMETLAIARQLLTVHQQRLADGKRRNIERAIAVKSRGFTG